MKTIREAVLRGEPIDFAPFVDVHGHWGPWAITCVPHCQDAGRLRDEMDRYGCDMVWMSASEPGYGDAMRVTNDIVFGLARELPDRVIPYCTLSACEQDRCLEELRRCLALGPCIGVKMHRYHQPAYTLKADFLQPVLETLEAEGVIYMNHDLGDLDTLRWAAAKYPRLTFMDGHFRVASRDLCAEHTNVCDCTCAAMVPDEVRVEVARRGRSDNLLVGSDIGLLCLAFGIGMVAYADIPEPDKRNILGLNAIRLLERTRWFRKPMIRKAW